MRAPYTQLYLHCVWATWDRWPLVVPQVEQAVYSAILAKCRALTCEPVAIGGMPDHVHLLVRLSTTLAVADLVKGVKGASSHLISHETAPAEYFKWQGSYGAFTVGKDAVERVRHYIERQREYHVGGQIVPDWEQTATEPERWSGG